MRTLVLGATSAIAQEVSKLFANEGHALFLVGRDKIALDSIGADLKVRGARSIEVFPMDLSHIENHEQLIESAMRTLGGLDVAFIAYGTLSNQQACQRSVRTTLQELSTNFTSVASLLTILANYFESRRSGCIAVITSVAGDRGRRSNYVYGAAKGALTLFLQGLRSRLSASGVSVITIKPGLVDTPMTAALDKNALFADPKSVARDVYTAIRKQKDIVYTPWFWSPIMTVIRAIPERLFKCLPL